MLLTYQEKPVLLRQYHQMTFKFLESRKVIEKSDRVIENNLVHARVTCLKTRLTRCDQIILHQKFEHRLV